jgi:hypothetical protein
VRLVLVMALASSLIAGCFGLSADGTMCEVGGTLSTATTVAEQAAAKDADGDPAGAQQLALQAAELATHGHDLLQTITSTEVKRGDTWQALLGAYVHIGQAANALLPAYSGGYGITEQELTAASNEMRTATARLPARCFATGAAQRGHAGAG